MRRTIFCKLFDFSGEFGKLILRLTLAVMIFPHGAQKVFGLFGGNGLGATWKYFTETLHIASPLAALAIFTELLAPVLLALGIFPRAAAALLLGLMAVAMQYHVGNGFFLNWTGAQPGEGVEYHLLFIGAALSVLLLGGGRFSLLRFSRECDGNACPPSASR